MSIRYHTRTKLAMHTGNANCNALGHVMHYDLRHYVRHRGRVGVLVSHGAPQLLRVRVRVRVTC